MVSILHGDDGETEISPAEANRLRKLTPGPMTPISPRMADLREWQSIANAPKDGSALLLWPTIRECVGVFHWSAEHDSWVDDLGGRYLGQISATHWMPLPEPPGWYPAG